MPLHPRLPDLVLILITLLWGTTFLAVQTALRWAGPFWVVALRFGIAAVLAAWLARPLLAGLTRHELRVGVLIGSVLFASYGLQTHGLAGVSSSQSAFLTALYVPLVPLVQWGVFRSRPALAAWLGVALAFIGLVLLAEPRDMQLNLSVGAWLTLAGAAAIALEICLVSRFAADCQPRRVAVVQLGWVALLSALGGWLNGEPLPALQAPALWLIVLGLGVATALIQIGMNWAQKTVPATRATVLYAMEPVWAGLVGWLAGERLSGMALAGAGLVVISVVVSQLGARWKPG